VLVVVEAEHLCFSILSARRLGSRTVTTASTGTMKKESTQNEVLNLIRA
jgi:GTP cyclohydrolase I